MNLNHEPAPDRESEFERRLRALPADDAARAEHQAALRDQARAAFEEAAQVHASRPRWRQILHLGRDLMKRPIPRWTAAASVLAVAIWMLVPRTDVAAAFAKMVDAVVSARSARFQAEINVEGQPKQTSQVLFLEPSKYRMEMNKMISISDFDAAKILSLMPEQKQAVVFNLKNIPKDGTVTGQVNHFERLRRLLKEQRDQLPPFERLGEKMIDGRQALGFRFESGIGTLTLWGDAKSGHPLRIENLYSGVPKTEVVMTKFEMDVEVKADLFALDIPQDYKVQSFDIDASKPQERDFVESLKVCAAMSGGTFPDALDTQSVMKLIMASVLSKKEKAKEPDVEQLMKDSFKIGRGFQFALDLPAAAKAHYAGKGVKQGTKDRPIFWYLPEGAQRYRVIDATLETSDADQAPRIEGAMPLGKQAASSESR